MGYLINELSQKSRYHLSKHRYLELRHHRLQYQEWKERLADITDISAIDPERLGSNQISNETERIALEKSMHRSKITYVEKIAMETDTSLWVYILKGVTEEGVTYTYLRNMMDIPCSKNMYYDRYRRFFWLMDRNDR